LEGVGGEKHGAEFETRIVGLLTTFGSELDAVVGDCLVDLPVLVAFGLGVTDAIRPIIRGGNVPYLGKRIVLTR